jgi:DNA polymerase III delta subunit
VSADVPVLAYFRGDDGYSIDRAVDAIARRMEEGSGAPPERWRTRGDDTNAAIITERVATAPMFGGGTLAVVADPAPLLRSKHEREALEHALRSVAPGNALVLLGTSDIGKQEKRPAALRNLETAVLKAGGDARTFEAPTAGGLAAWIEARATELGTRLAPGAAKELARRVGGFVREGDVDRRGQGSLAVAELRKLALYRPYDPVTEEDVRALVADAIPDSTWAFLDAVAERRARQAGPLLDRLLASTPEPVVIAQLHRRLRELLIAADLVEQRASPTDMVRMIGGHPFRVQKLAEQARAWSVAELEAALEGVLELDAMVKGAKGSRSTDAQRRLAFVLWVEERVATGGPAAGRTAAGGLGAGHTAAARPVASGR